MYKVPTWGGTLNNLQCFALFGGDEDGGAGGSHFLGRSRQGHLPPHGSCSCHWLNWLQLHRPRVLPHNLFSQQLENNTL